MFALVFSIFVNPTSASAARVFSLSSWDIENKKPTFGVSGYEAKSIGVIVDDTDLDSVKFYISFYNSISSTTFANSSRSPLARIKIFKNVSGTFSFTGNAGDIWIDATGVTFQGTTPVTAKATALSIEGNSSSSRISLEKCQPKVWIENIFFQYAVGFSISRLCSNIGSNFSVIGLVDSDTNNSESYPDFQWVPEKGVAIDLSKVAMPPKKSQTVTISQQSNVSIGLGKLIVNASSSTGLPVLLSTNGSNCRFETANSSTLTLTGIGTCTVNAYANGDNEYNNSANVTMSFQIQQLKSTQQVTVDPVPASSFVGTQLTVSAKSSSGLNPTYSVPTTTSVCRFNDSTKPSVLTLLAAGTCTFEVFAPESNNYIASSKVVTSFTVQNLIQQRFSIGQLGNIAYEQGTVSLSTSSDTGQRNLTILTTNTCLFTDNSGAIIRFVGSGVCTVEGFAPASGQYGQSQTVRMSFTILPAKVSQNIYISQIGSIDISDGNVYLNISSQSGQWVISSLSDTVCQVNNSTSNRVILYGAGTCTIEGYAPAYGQYLASQRTQMSFRVFITKKNRDVEFTEPSSARVGDLIDLDISSDSDNYPDISVTTPKICSIPDWNYPYRLKMLTTGTCKFKLSLSGSDYYFPYSSTKSFVVKAKAATSSSNSSKTKSGPSIGGTASTTNTKGSSPAPTKCANVSSCGKKS